MSKPEIVVEPGKLEIIVTMTFNAPKELVFKAYTDASLIPQWWGPRYLTTEIDQLDARPGGRWRFVQRDPDGNVHAFHGVFHGHGRRKDARRLPVGFPVSRGPRRDGRVRHGDRHQRGQ